MDTAFETYEQRLSGDPSWALREGSMHFAEGNEVHKTLKKIARRLDDLEIDYVLTGGLAIYFHGYRRFTEDVDLLVTPDSLQRIHESLEGLGYVRLFAGSKALRDAETRVKIDFLTTGDYPGDGKPGPVAFPDPKEVALDLNGMKVIQLPRLIELKLASGMLKDRYRDLGDVQELIRVLELPLEMKEEIDSSLHERYEELWQAVKDSQPREF